MKPVLSFIAPAVLILTTSLAGTPAFAGFQWVPPQSSATVLSSEQVQTDDLRASPENMIGHIRSGAPVQDVPAPQIRDAQPAPLAPIQSSADSTFLPEPVTATPAPLEHEPIALAPITATPSMPALSEVERAQPSMPTPQPAPMQQQPVMNEMPAPVSASAAPQIDDSQTVVGFGDKLPLALALGEIVPPTYSYAFSPEVNPGVAASWDGQGRRWDVVLNDMLAAHGLGLHIRGRTVMIASARVAAVTTQTTNQSTHTPLAPQQQQTQQQNIRVQQSSPASSPIRVTPPPAQMDVTAFPAAPSEEPFSDSYEPIVLTPDGMR
jgi:hypothetical protein